MSSAANSSRPPRILLQVSASIAAFKAVALCSKLVQAQFDVEVVLSPDAHYFVGPASFEGLTGRKVHQGNFDEGFMMAHIQLERWADLILLYPASANTLAQLAQGQSQSLIGALFLAHEFKKPYWIIPAMNQAMIAHPATQKNLKTLGEWNIRVWNSESGSLACGEVGAGRLIEPETVLHEIVNYFESNSAWQKNPEAAFQSQARSILITAGGTTEPIDTVRSLTNFSTGKTGYLLAQALSTQGHRVTLLQSKYSHFQAGPFSTVLYDTTQDFAQKMQQILEAHSFDSVIHAAAVADYSVEAVMNAQGEVLNQTAKIQSSEGLLLKLKPNPKVLQSVRTWSKNKQLKLISFKLTSGSGQDLKLETYDSDFVIHNELDQVSGSEHAGALYEKTAEGSFQLKTHFKTKTELSRLIQQLVTEETQ